jgi:hypothetical protein
MATEKRLIDANALMKAIKSFRWFGVPNTLQLMFDYLKIIIRDQPTVDAVEVDTVIEMFEYMLGDCPCNFSPVDEWLAERCELQNECPNPKDKHGCWKQFIKHFVAEMDGERKDHETG